MSSLKTVFLNLNKWIGTDSPKREEIVENFDIIDSKMQSHDTQLNDIAIDLKNYPRQGAETDDTARFERALQNGKNLILEKGALYNISCLNITSGNIVIIGNNATIQANTVRSDFITVDANNIVIKDLTIDINNKTNSAITIKANRSNIAIDNCNIRNCFDNGNGLIVAGITVLNNTSNINITNNIIENMSATPNGTEGDDSGASRAILIGDWTNNLLPKNILISNCVISNITPREDGDGIQITGGLGSTDYLNIIIEKCSFKGCAKRAIKIMAPGVTIRDNDILNDSASTLSDRTDSMHTAISVYASNVKVLNNYIHGNSFYTVIEVGATDPYATNMIEIDGNTIEVMINSTIDVQWGSIMCAGHTTGMIIKNNLIKNGRSGIYLSKFIQDALLQGNTIRNVSHTGIELSATNIVTMDDIVITGNIINSNGFGLSIDSGMTNTTAIGNIIKASWDVINGDTEVLRSGNIGYNEFISRIHKVTSLLPADLRNYGSILLQKNNGADDTLYTSIKLADGTYTWKKLVTDVNSWAGVVNMVNTVFRPLGVTKLTNYVDFEKVYSSGGTQPTLTKTLWKVSEISTDSANPTTIGTAGAINLQVYRNTDGIVCVKYSAPGNNYDTYFKTSFC